MRFWSDPTSKDAFIFSWISVILTLVAATTGITYYKATKSSLCLVFGLENCVDLLSSVVVVWRFYVPIGKTVTEEREKLLEKREERASVAISFILILLGLFVCGGALSDLVNGPESENDLTIVLNISFTSIFVFGALAIIKFQYSKKLKSPSLYKDGLCSLLGTILASALFVNTFIIEKYPQRWWLDPVVSILCGVAAFGIGVQAVWVASRVLPIFSAQWWLVSQGDSKIEMPKKEAEGEKSKLSEVV